MCLQEAMLVFIIWYRALIRSTLKEKKITCSVLDELQYRHKDSFEQSLLQSLKLCAVYHGGKERKKKLLQWFTVGGVVVIWA